MTFSLRLAVGLFSYVEYSLVPINLHRCWPRERIRSPHVPINCIDADHVSEYAPFCFRKFA